MSQADWLEKDFYKALGVSKDANAEEIRKAYRTLARKNHPDANPDDAKAEERFKELGEAHDVLGDKAKRAEYDHIRSLAGSGGLGGFGNARSGGGRVGGFDVSDLLGGLFGEQGGGARSGGRGARGGGGAQAGNDLAADVTLSFDDAMAGVTVTLRLTGSAMCSVCKGIGAEPGTMPQRCDRCGGAGQVSQNQGMFSFAQPCPKCGGRGEVITNPCHNCHGSGVEDRPRTIKARLPAGVADLQTVRLRGKGEPGRNGGKPGDLMVTVHVSPHQVLRRKGDNLLLNVPITFAEAALGAKVSVPTMDGSVTLKIPAGTESGKTFRVRGRGAPSSGKGGAGRSGGAKNGGGRNGNGDLLVTVQVVVPEKLTKTQKKVVEEFASMDDSNPRGHLEHLLVGEGQ